MLFQYLIVAFVVLLAALYAGAKYLPKAWRQRLVYTLSNGTGKGRLVAWLDTGSSCGGGCDSGGCNTCAPAALPERDAQGRKVIKLHVQR
ncbi:DUF6587 family protein [Massilia sp. TN1-12]|uniref:DUF6587 family protein n=1 Tax=Massilia paldalensis TaxID=3377675 RepID=UPI00384CE297